jgi:uncharacterized ParB-like nuclease family protein
MREDFKMERIETVLVKCIVADPAVNARANGLDAATIEEYVAAIQAGNSLPPISVVFENVPGRDMTIWVYDGFHRLEAAKRCGDETIQAIGTPGGHRTAMLLAAGANHEHGLKRTNSDKRRAVERLLDDTEWSKWSDREIARRCGVSDRFVNGIRAERASANTRRCAEIGDNSIGQELGDQRRVKRGDTTYTMKTAGIGAQPPKQAVTAPSAATSTSQPGCATHGINTGGNPPMGSTPAAKKAAKKRVKPSKGSINDDYGTEIPDHARASFDDPWLQESINFLELASENFRSKRFSDGMNKRKKLWPFFNAKDFGDCCGQIIHNLDQLIDHLKDFRPSGVCPACDGQKCARCRQTGLVCLGIGLDADPGNVRARNGDVDVSKSEKTADS